MSMEMNRQQKRMMQRMGAVNEQGAAVRQPVVPQARRDRVGPVRYLREVREEMRRVAWPTATDVRRYAIIVLVTVVVVTAVVGGFDALFGIFSGWLYKD
jgi:preprotein translocase subunit SecE